MAVHDATPGGAENPPLATFSPERRAHAIRLLRDEGILTHPSLSDDAKLFFTVGLLICDETGYLPKADLQRGMEDPSIRNVARQIMAEATL